MSEYSNGTSPNTASASAESLGVGRVQEQVGEAVSRTKSRFDRARQPVADRLHGAAHRVRGAAGSAADRLEESADYIKSRDARRMMQDLVSVIRSHPARSLAIAGVIGFLIARAFRRKD